MSGLLRVLGVRSEHCKQMWSYKFIMLGCFALTIQAAQGPAPLDAVGRVQKQFEMLVAVARKEFGKPIDATTRVAQQKPCQFDLVALSFEGTALDQALCLLRPLRPYGIVANAHDGLSEPLQTLMTSPFSVSTINLQPYLTRNGIDASDIGGPVDKPICKARNNSVEAPTARYFVIHDTSSPELRDSFPIKFDTPSWPGNQLAPLAASGKAHVFINRVGDSITGHDFSVPWRATQFENHIGIPAKGLFLHVELIQPRLTDHKRPPLFPYGPDPGFSSAQLERLAVVYVAASIRAKTWLIPAYHGVLDMDVGDHDDPQNFNLQQWSTCIANLLSALK